ncbi:DoxX family protein [Parapedobacter koreensis]|uniref:DoxX-like family protein n=1 Tax=Parapedobacter koreensis TaxID=332977 RepID=A0A1H7ICV6_9SPHI|nr:DoxX family protein [Parapedobacter koreensis]SEK58445.1 DoxX-like family protein [Parapedobacter koreensis]
MKQNVIYWIATGLISLMMLFSGYAYFTDPNVSQGFTHLGFPSYFRIQLGVAKIIGVLFLLLPFVPIWLKEWTYVGFGITFISAFIAHVASGDPTSVVIGPVVAFIVLLVSYVYLRKQKFAKSSVGA